MVTWACVIWVWFDCSWKDGYKILEWLFRPSPESSCGHSWEILEEAELAQSVPLFLETSRCRQVEPGSACSRSGRGKYYRKKYCILLLFLKQKEGREGSFLLRFQGQAAMFCFLLSISRDLQNVRSAALNQITIILLPTEAVRERSTSLTHSQKLSGQSVLNKVLHWKRQWGIIPHSSTSRIPAYVKGTVEYSICSTRLLDQCYYYEEYPNKTS